MKSILMTAIILCMMALLHIWQAGSQYKSIPKKLATATKDQVFTHTADYGAMPGKTCPEEPAGVLNQASNIILPALKMFQ